MIFTSTIEELLEYYDNLMEMYKSAMSESPPGSLIIQKNKGNDQYLHLFNKNGKRMRKGINKDREMIRALARKEFARKSLQVLEPDVALLKNALNNIVPFDPDEILKSMSKAYRKLPEEYFFNRSFININLKLDDEMKARIDRHRDWGRQPYEQSDYLPQYKKHITSKGLKVRSKSEVLICECCHKWYDLPFRYEQIQVINGVIISPDLTFEDYKREYFYWEHLGMMDNPDYADRNFRKLERYYDAGLIPGDNLILSFDRCGDIDMRIINDIIRNQIIPRL